MPRHTLAVCLLLGRVRLSMWNYHTAAAAAGAGAFPARRPRADGARGARGGTGCVHGARVLARCNQWGPLREHWTHVGWLQRPLLQST